MSVPQKELPVSRSPAKERPAEGSSFQILSRSRGIPARSAVSPALALRDPSTLSFFSVPPRTPWFQSFSRCVFHKNTVPLNCQSLLCRRQECLRSFFRGPPCPSVVNRLVPGLQPSVAGINTSTVNAVVRIYASYLAPWDTFVPREAPGCASLYVSVAPRRQKWEGGLARELHEHLLICATGRPMPRSRLSFGGSERYSGRTARMSKRVSGMILLLMAMGILWQSSARADSILFDRSGLRSDWGNFSDVDGGREGASRFSFTEDNYVTRIEWWGEHFPSGTESPGGDDFTIRFYTDSSGLPGLLVNALNVGDVARVDTGIDTTFNIDVFHL